MFYSSYPNFLVDDFWVIEVSSLPHQGSVVPLLSKAAIWHLARVAPLSVVVICGFVPGRELILL
jgi:hypothetical protein